MPQHTSPPYPPSPNSPTYSRPGSRSRSSSRPGRSHSVGATPRRRQRSNSPSTKPSDKTKTILGTSLVFLGAVGAASIVANKYWPKGITYGEKEDWAREDNKRRSSHKHHRHETRGRASIPRGGSAHDLGRYPDEARYIDRDVGRRDSRPVIVDDVMYSSRPGSSLQRDPYVDVQQGYSNGVRRHTEEGYSRRYHAAGGDNRHDPRDRGDAVIRAPAPRQRVYIQDSKDLGRTDSRSHRVIRDGNHYYELP
ncbi:hypothetical protein F4778DRAFT_742027 [Xylariomycetidae sp. FL2044]|nr:hypothetical protein F4778DRAFT_742027 [Xylariomycetidae sp. FL2044]